MYCYNLFHTKILAKTGHITSPIFTFCLCTPSPSLATLSDLGKIWFHGFCGGIKLEEGSHNSIVKYHSVYFISDLCVKCYWTRNPLNIKNKLVPCSWNPSLGAQNIWCKFWSCCGSFFHLSWSYWKYLGRHIVLLIMCILARAHTHSQHVDLSLA